MSLFKHLTPAQEAEFRQWARDNYEPLGVISGVWHPVVQDECAKINAETGKSFRAPPPAPRRPTTERQES